jgi:hypothetical protein
MSKLEVLLFLGVAFFVVDTYYDNKYTKQFSNYKKYIKIGTILFTAGSVLLFMRKNPGESTKLLGHLNGMVQYMPIDKNSIDLITPFFTKPDRSEQTIQTSGNDTNTRCVSGTKKKYVAASQQWKCGECNTQLDAWFEVDHKIRVADGGSNHISNLVALCRNCHGKKTTFENM